MGWVRSGPPDLLGGADLSCIQLQQMAGFGAIRRPVSVAHCDAFGSETGFDDR